MALDPSICQPPFASIARRSGRRICGRWFDGGRREQLAVLHDGRKVEFVATKAIRSASCFRSLSSLRTVLQVIASGLKFLQVSQHLTLAIRGVTLILVMAVKFVGGGRTKVR